MKSNASYAGLLTAIFIIAFAIPLTFAAKVSGMFSSEGDFENSKTFPQAINVFTAERRVDILGSEGFNPRDSKDFLLSAWFQIKRLPKAGQRAIFLSKYDSQSKNRAGYALAVSKTADSLRPEVYWKGKNGEGGWFTFSEIDLIPGQWYRLLVSFYDGKYLGVHGHAYSKEPVNSPDLLGGFSLEEGIEVKSSSGISLGSLGSKNFRGRIGPISILHLDGLKDSFENTWRTLSADDALSAWDSDSVALWIEEGVDKSQSARKLKVKGGKSKLKKKKALSK